MPAIPLKRIMAVSSEDAIHKASNLLCPSAGLHWFCSSIYRSKCLSVEIELAKLSRIAHIEVGNLRSAFVEVLVSDTVPTNNGAGPSTSCNTGTSSGVGTGGRGVGERGGGTGYVSLLPQSMLMTSEESKNGRNTTRSKIFSQDKLSRTAIDKKWKYIKIQCLQPYLFDKPYGLRYIKFYQSHTHSLTLDSTDLTSSSNTNKLSLFNTPQHHSSFQTPTSSTRKAEGPYSALHLSGYPKTPKLPSLTSSRGSEIPETSSVTPKRPKREVIEDSQEFEFAGLEKQSRLLKGTLRGDKELLATNPILSRIAKEKENSEEERRKEEEGSGYVRRKLLHRELNSVENKGVDFTSSYDEKSAKWERMKTARLYSSMKVNQLDDSCEMGEEDEKDTFFKVHSKRGKRSRSSKGSSRGNSKGSKLFDDVLNNSGWIKRGKGKTPLITSTPSSFWDDHVLPSSLIIQSKQTKLVDFYENCNVLDGSSNKEEPLIISEEEEERDTISGTKNNKEEGRIDSLYSSLIGEGGVQMCPICNDQVPLYALELHASECAERTFDDSTSHSINTFSDNSNIITEEREGREGRGRERREERKVGRAPVKKTNCKSVGVIYLD